MADRTPDLRSLQYPRHVHAARMRMDLVGVSLIVKDHHECAAALATGLWFLTPILLGATPVAPPPPEPSESASPPDAEPPPVPKPKGGWPKGRPRKVVA